MSIKKPQKHRHLPAFILLTLARSSAHGGAIYTSLIEKIPNFQCDTGAIYRTLNQLEEEKAVTFCWDTSISGPARKIYSITECGLKQLDAWKNEIEERIVMLNYFIEEYYKLKK